MGRIAYLVHDLADAAVRRRVRIFHAGGATVSLAGFYRRAAPESVDGVQTMSLGRTADAQLKRRAMAVVQNILNPASARRIVVDADVIVARNLEMLAIAARVASPAQRIIYECLDIHRLLTANSAAGTVVRAAERRVMKRVSLILTSSPAFEREYFHDRQRYRVPVRIEENKVLAPDGASGPSAVHAGGEGPPWRIGWFGMLRCRRSLAMLRDLVVAARGRLEVVIAGVPSLGEFSDFYRDVTDTPGLRFLGSYTADDLPRLYRGVHFAWTIDYFEEGLNSTWLLPNRLYESVAHGAVPIALAGVETGRWLLDRGAGLLLNDPRSELGPIVASLDAMDFARLVAAVGRVPRTAVVTAREDCVALTRAVLGEAA